MASTNEPAKPPGPYFLWCMSGNNRESVVESLGDDSRNKAAVNKALGLAWKNLPGDQKQLWKEKNNEMKQTFENYKRQGGVVSPGAYAKAKARKKKGASTARGKKRSAEAAEILANFSNEEILEEISRRLNKRPRTGDPDSGGMPTAEVSQGDQEATQSHREASASADENAEAPSPAELLRKFGKRVPEEERCGMEAWMTQRMLTITTNLRTTLGKSPSNKEVWLEAMRKWTGLSAPKKERWNDRAQ
eukprot:TRINITY_DN81084_c0_g1_i1.p1 TRINITY_DN81084_c0_g1~~TRINITY_DN81084_c0_g1_i1.p1  ORF type:complete len:264 (-),score=49.04 TRINITY_DN81084_c0_g1_i1:107-847(-)